MDLKEVEWEGLDRFGLTEGQVTGCSKNGNELSVYIKCGEFLVQMKTY